MFIRLTTISTYYNDGTYDTKTVCINVKNITYIKDISDKKDNFNINFKTRIVFNGGNIEVFEDINHIIDMINQHYFLTD